jgi:tetratricopeptide (TPR) repeat protein
VKLDCDSPAFAALLKMGFSKEDAFRNINDQANELIADEDNAAALNLLLPLLVPNATKISSIEETMTINAGRAALRMGNAKLALFLLIKVWMQSPDCIATNLNLGDTFVEIKAFDQARECYLAAKARAPRLPECEEKLGDLEYFAGNYAAAVAHYEKAIELCDEGDSPLRPKFMKALSQVELGKFNDALPFLISVTTKAPDSADAWLARARCEKALGVKTADECFERHRHLCQQGT